MKGIYILIIQLKIQTTLKIGKLGEKTLPQGTYAYVGSAQKNFEKRLQRHLRNEKHLFWHIDYLLNSPNAQITNIFIQQEAPKTEECRTAQPLSQHGTPIPRFGCSDCNCKSHLIYLTNPNPTYPKMQTYPLNPHLAKKT